MKYVFLAYINRSGSSFLANELSKCSTICVCPEADILFDFLCWNPSKTISNRYWINNAIPKLLNDYKFKTWCLTLKELKSIEFDSIKRVDLFFQILNAFKNKHLPSAQHIFFKHPEILRLVSFLSKSDYSFSTIILFRDPRGIYNSQHKAYLQNFKKVMSSESCKTALESRNFYLKSKKIKNTITVSFEDLITNPIQTKEKLSSEIKLEPTATWNEKGNYYQFLPNELKELHRNIEKDTITERISAWKKEMKKIDILIIQLFCKQYISDLNYTKYIVPVDFKDLLKIQVKMVTGFIRFFAEKKRFFKRILGVWPV